MRQRNTVIKLIVCLHLVWTEDLKKNTVLVIQSFTTKKAKSLCICLRQKVSMAVKKKDGFIHPENVMWRDRNKPCGGYGSFSLLSQHLSFLAVAALSFKVRR